MNNHTDIVKQRIARNICVLQDDIKYLEEKHNALVLRDPDGEDTASADRVLNVKWKLLSEQRAAAAALVRVETYEAAADKAEAEATLLITHKGSPATPGTGPGNFYFRWTQIIAVTGEIVGMYDQTIYGRTFLDAVLQFTSFHGNLDTDEEGISKVIMHISRAPD